MWLDSDTNKYYLINNRDGSRQLCDPVGGKVRRYIAGLTGNSSYIRRQEKAAELGLSQVAPVVPKKVKLNFEMLPLILAQSSQTKHLPERTQTEHF